MSSFYQNPPPEAYEKMYLDKLKFKSEVFGDPKETSSCRTAIRHPVGMEGNPGRIALIDMNSCFAVLEQQANPYLRGKAIGIVKDVGRSCVIAASPEAKKLGIKTGCSYYDAKKLCPGFITVAADFDKYFYNTTLLKQIFETLSPNTDIFSLDEAFLDITHCRHLYPDVETFFNIARKMVKEQLGEWVSFSLGVGENRLQAKLASEFAGKDHFFEITPDNLAHCLMEAKVEDICGIGYRLSSKLHQLNINHPYQLNFVDDTFLQDHFGVFWGPELRRIGQGKNSHLLDLIDKPPAHMKSVGRTKTLYKATTDREHLLQLICNLTEEMCFKTRKMKLTGHLVAVSLRDTDGKHYGGHFHLKNSLHHTDEVFQLISRLFANASFLAPIIKVGVYLGELQPISEVTGCWLPKWQQREKVFAAVDAVNQKFGLYTVKSARLKNFKILMPEVTGFLGDKVYQFGANS